MPRHLHAIITYVRKYEVVRIQKVGNNKMKMKWMATLAAAALVFTFAQAEPAEAYETGASVSLYGLEDSASEITMHFTGMDRGDRYVIQEQGAYTGAVSNLFPYEEGVVSIPKDQMPFLSSLKAGDTIEVLVVPGSASNNKEVMSFPRTLAETAGYVPQEMKVVDTILSRGDKDKTVRIEFNEYYKPGFFNELVFLPLDQEGKVLDGTKSFRLAADGPGDGGVRLSGDGKATWTEVGLDIPKDAYAYRVEFRDAGRVVDNLTKTLSVGDYFGKLSAISIEGQKYVQPGQEIALQVMALDTEGNKSDVTKLSRFGFSTNFLTAVEGKPGVFKVADNASVGSKFSVTAIFDGRSTALTLQVSQLVDAMKIYPPMATVGQKPQLDFQLVDNKGQNAVLNWQPSQATISFRNVSNPQAGLSGTITNLGDIDLNGSGALTLEAQAPTTAEVVVTLKKDDQSLELSAGTFTFSAPKKEPINVIMGIGSSQLIINGKEAGRMDTYPIILQDRTFIPLRAMAEAFGATVDFNYDRNKEIRITLGDDEVVMHVGSKNYTRNGSAAVMDVAPYINSDNRTMVPVRFAAEALGFKVDANTHADGTTANVVISNDLS